LQNMKSPYFLKKNWLCQKVESISLLHIGYHNF
jgi:hypothetical protein